MNRVITASAAKQADSIPTANETVTTPSAKPLVPERLFVAGGMGGAATGGQTGQGLMGLLISLLVAEKSGFSLAQSPELDQLKQFSDRMVQDAMQSMSAKNDAEVLAKPKA